MEPFIDFSKADNLPEGVSAEALATPAVQEYIKAQVEPIFANRFEVQASGLKKTNEQLKEEKAKLKGYLDETNKKYEGVDLDEIARLKELASSGGDAARQLEVAATERAAMVEAYDNKLANASQEIQERDQLIQAMELKTAISDGIREHNGKFPSVALEAGQERWIEEEARRVWKRDAEGNYTPMEGDKVLTGADGNIMNYAEWVNSLREQTAFSRMFKQPSGGGAAGGGGGAGGQHFNVKNFGGTQAERTAAIAAKLNLPR